MTPVPSNRWPGLSLETKTSIYDIGYKYEYHFGHEDCGALFFFKTALDCHGNDANSTIKTNVSLLVGGSSSKPVKWQVNCYSSIHSIIN